MAYFSFCSSHSLTFLPSSHDLALLLAFFSHEVIPHFLSLFTFLKYFPFIYFLFLHLFVCIFLNRMTTCLCLFFILYIFLSLVFLLFFSLYPFISPSQNASSLFIPLLSPSSCSPFSFPSPLPSVHLFFVLSSSFILSVEFNSFPFHSFLQFQNIMVSPVTLLLLLCLLPSPPLQAGKSCLIICHNWEHTNLPQVWQAD